MQPLGRSIRHKPQVLVEHRLRGAQHAGQGDWDNGPGSKHCIRWLQDVAAVTAPAIQQHLRH